VVNLNLATRLISNIAIKILKEMSTVQQQVVGRVIAIIIAVDADLVDPAVAGADAITITAILRNDFNYVLK
jgi:hypothetical protein